MSISKKIFFLIIIFSLIFFSFPKKIQSFQKSWQYYLKKGLVQYKYEIYDYSILNLQKALAQNGKLFIAANTLAEIYKIKKQRKEAIDYYKISLEINYNQDEIHYRIAGLYDFFAEYKLAFKHYKESIKINPGHIKSNMSLVRFYFKKNDKKNASLHFKISYERGKKYSKKYFDKGTEEKNKGNYVKAITNYKKAIEFNPAIIEAYVAIFRIYRIIGNYIEAAKIIEKLKFLKPDYEMAYIFLASTYFNRKLPGKRKYYIDKAILNLEKLLKINPENKDALYTLWRIYNYIGKDLKAKKFLKKWEKIEDMGSGKN